MAWTSISKRAVGVCVPKSWLDTFIDNLTFLYNAMGGSGTGTSGSLQNGSFENDTDADGIPDGWTRTLYTGGSLAIETTDVAHGAKAIKFTSPGGAGNGGGYIDNDDYILCSAVRPVAFAWTMWGTADVNNLVDILFYDKAKGYISTTNVYTNATTNPTAETRYHRASMPPATARYFRLRFTGCKNDDTTIGSTYFDDVLLVAAVGSVVGFAEVATGAYHLDRITIGGTLSSPTIGIGVSPMSLSGARKNVPGGSVAVSSIDGSSNTLVTVTLDLSYGGLWTVYATATSYYASEVANWHGITAMAIREG